MDIIEIFSDDDENQQNLIFISSTEEEPFSLDEEPFPVYNGSFEPKVVLSDKNAFPFIFTFVYLAIKTIPTLLFLKDNAVPPEVLNIIISMYYALVYIHPNNILHIVDEDKKKMINKCICGYTGTDDCYKKKYDTIVTTEDILNNGKSYCKIHSKDKMKNIFIADKWNFNGEPIDCDGHSVINEWTTIVGTKNLFLDQGLRVCPNIHGESDKPEYLFFAQDLVGYEAYLCSICRKECCLDCFIHKGDTTICQGCIMK